MEENKNIEMVAEAALAYNASTKTMSAILGGQVGLSNGASELDLIRLSREGLKKETLYSLAAYLSISMDQLSTLLHTSYRNLLRKDAGDMLDSYKTEKVLELASFTNRGMQVLGSKEAFQQWVHSPLLALGNKKPIDFLDTTFGIQMVTKVLGRLEQGVYS